MPSGRVAAVSAGEIPFSDAGAPAHDEHAMPHETFCAYDDAGNRYTVHVRRTYIDARGASGLRRVEGLRSYHLSDGEAVDRLADGSFAIAASGRALRVRGAACGHSVLRGLE